METAVMIFGILNVGIIVLHRLVESQNKWVFMNELALVATIIAFYLK